MKKSLTIFLAAYTAFLVTEHFRTKAQVPFPGGGNGGGGGSSSGAITQLAKQTLAMSASSFTFSSIPSGYNNLIFKIYGRGDTAATSTNVAVQINGDSATNYDYNFGGSADTAFNGSSGYAQTSGLICALTAANNTASFMGGCEFEIYGYTQTTFFKEGTARNFLRSTTAPNNLIQISSFDWKSTNAVTSVVFSATAGNFITGSTIIMYGLN